MSERGSISVLIPTYNEAENINDLLPAIIKILDGTAIKYEILVIDDDSPDNTAEIAQGLLLNKGRAIRRLGKEKSLSLSVLDGIKEASGDSILVMDADGSHAPELIPEFIKTLQEGYSLVIASRYVKGGGSQGFPFIRKVISRFACFLGRAVTNIKDNTSGFFCIRRSSLEGARLTPQGFKIGLEIFVKARVNSFKEIPYTFTNRKKGKSKLGANSVFQYLAQIFSLLIYKMFKR